MQSLLQDMVERYGDRIYRLALRYSGDCNQAQDITQDTFLKAFENMDRFDSTREPGPWLFTIATNICRNRWRDNRETPVERIEDFSQAVRNNPETIFFEREKERELALALDQLPQIYREVILLKHVGELSYQEICQTLGLELSLVKNRLYRGRLMLKDLLMKGSE